jgi:hypothetical protein
MTAHGGRPIVSLLDIVRFAGEPHAEIEALERGDEFLFDEPDWELPREQEETGAGFSSLGT